MDSKNLNWKGVTVHHYICELTPNIPKKNKNDLSLSENKRTMTLKGDDQYHAPANQRLLRNALWLCLPRNITELPSLGISVNPS